jgi:hypothetical protein
MARRRRTTPGRCVQRPRPRSLRGRVQRPSFVSVAQLTGHHRQGQIRPEFYATQRFNLPHLHAQIVNRIVMGNKVIDHERITGVRTTPFEMVVIFEIADNLIQRIWSLSPE